MEGELFNKLLDNLENTQKSCIFNVVELLISHFKSFKNALLETNMKPLWSDCFLHYCGSQTFILLIFQSKSKETFKSSVRCSIHIHRIPKIYSEKFKTSLYAYGAEHGRRPILMTLETQQFAIWLLQCISMMEVSSLPKTQLPTFPG